MRQIVFDLETIPNEDLIPNAELIRDTLRAPGNYKNPDVIEQWKDRQMGEIVHKMGLHPLTGRICSAGYAVYEDGTLDTLDGLTLGHNINTEAELLEKLSAILATADQIVTFNGKKFDISFYEVRSRINGVTYTPFTTNPYYKDDHVDLMLEIGTPMRLDEIRAWLGIGKRTESLGDQVWTLWQEGKVGEIHKHCLDDIEATGQLGVMLGFIKDRKVPEEFQ